MQLKKSCSWHGSIPSEGKDVCWGIFTVEKIFPVKPGATREFCQEVTPGQQEKFLEYYFEGCLKTNLDKFLHVLLKVAQGWPSIFLITGVGLCWKRSAFLRGFLCKENEKSSVVPLKSTSSWPSDADSCASSPQHRQQTLQPQEGTWKPPTETTPTRNSRLTHFIFAPKANLFG